MEVYNPPSLFDNHFDVNLLICGYGTLWGVQPSKVNSDVSIGRTPGTPKLC